MITDLEIEDQMEEKERQGNGVGRRAPIQPKHRENMCVCRKNPTILLAGGEWSRQVEPGKVCSGRCVQQGGRQAGGSVCVCVCRQAW